MIKLIRDRVSDTRRNRGAKVQHTTYLENGAQRGEVRPALVHPEREQECIYRMMHPSAGDIDELAVVDETEGQIPVRRCKTDQVSAGSFPVSSTRHGRPLVAPKPFDRI